MKRVVLVGGLLCLSSLSVVVMAGCGAPPPDLMKNPGPQMCDATKYPCGPYGYVQGSVVTNLQLLGRRDDNHNGTPTDDPVRPIYLSDYYQNKSVKVLAVLVAAEWCGPCRAEQSGLVDLYAKYKSHGVAFVEAIVQDLRGNPADIATVDRWTNTAWPPGSKKIDFDMVADPSDVLGPYYNIAAFPMQMVVRTSDMTIQWQNNGLAIDTLDVNINALLK